MIVLGWLIVMTHVKFKYQSTIWYRALNVIVDSLWCTCIDVEIIPISKYCSTRETCTRQGSFCVSRSTASQAKNLYNGKLTERLSSSSIRLLNRQRTYAVGCYINIISSCRIQCDIKWKCDTKRIIIDCSIDTSSPNKTTVHYTHTGCCTASTSWTTSIIGWTSTIERTTVINID